MAVIEADPQDILDQQLAVDAAEAQDRADAEAARKAAIASQKTGILGQAGATLGEFARSVGEGVAAIPDMPVRIATGLKNIPTRIENLSRPADQQQPLADPNNMDLFGQGPGHGLAVENLYNKYMPVTPGYEDSLTRKAGNVAGPVIVSLPFGPAGAAGRGIIGSGVRTAVTTGGVLGGSELGGRIGEAITGGEGGRTYGELLGGTIGGGITPEGITSAGYRVLRPLLTDPGSQGRLTAAEAIDVPPSLGLVGNKLSGVLEDASVGVPFGGGPAYAARRAQYAAMDAAARDIAALQRPVIRPNGVIDEAQLGQGAIDVATVADRALQDRINALYEDPQTGLHGQTDPQTGQPLLPRDAPINVTGQRATYDSLLQDPLVSQSLQGPTIRHFRDILRADSTLPVDPALEQQLQGRRAGLMAQPASPQRDAALAQVESDILDNRGPSFQAQRIERGHGTRTDTGVALDARMREAIRVAQTASMRDAAVAAGIPAATFDAIEAQVSDLLGQQGAIEGLTPDRLGNAVPQGQAYSKLFATGGQRNLDQLAALRENNPAGLAQLFADQFERQFRGPVSAGLPEAVPETLQPRMGSSWWAKQPEEAKQIYAPGPVRNAADALAETMRADLRRPTRTLPGAGGNTLGAPATLFQNPALLGGIAALAGGGAGAGVLGLPGLAAAAIPSIVARTISGRLTDPAFTRNVVNPPPMRLDLSRLLSAAAGAIGAH